MIVFVALSLCGCQRQVEFDLFLVAYAPTEVTGERIGCDDVLVKVDRQATLQGSRLETALRALFAEQGSSNLKNGLEGVEMTSVLIDGSDAKVRLKPFQVTGVCQSPRIGMQLKRTAGQFDEIDSVTFFVGDDTLEQYLSRM